MRCVLVFFIACVFAINGHGQSKKPPKDRLLDKKTFYTEIQESGKKKAVWLEDEISFRSGKMGSKLLQFDYGFLKGEYIIVEKMDIDGDLILRFEGINKNSKGQSLKWTGEVFGDAIKGNATLSKKGKIKRQFEFMGSLKVRGQKRKPINDQP